MGCSTQTKTKEIKVYELKRYTITKNGNFFFSDRLTKKADINKYYKLKQEYLGKGSS
jgi:hypothetical protein